VCCSVLLQRVRERVGTFRGENQSESSCVERASASFGSAGHIYVAVRCSMLQYGAGGATKCCSVLLQRVKVRAGTLQEHPHHVDPQLRRFFSYYFIRLCFWFFFG